MSQPIVVLITGANRGLGKALLGRYLAKPNHIVIAANRNPSHPTSVALADLPKGEGSRLIIVKIDASADTDASAAVEELTSTHGIKHLDIVIANAGVSYVWPKVVELRLSDLRGHIEPNVYGMVSLYQATHQLMKKSPREPVFAPMGSTAGWVRDQPAITNAAYGASKAIVNWYAVRIHAEDEWLNSFVLCPGFVKTDMGITGATGLGFDPEMIEKTLLSVEESCDGMMKALDQASREKYGGKMVWYNGDVTEC